MLFYTIWTVLIGLFLLQLYSFYQNKIKMKCKCQSFEAFSRGCILLELEMIIFLDCMFLSCHVAFEDESTLYSCLNVKELLAQSRREIGSLSNCNWTRTHKHLVHKRTLNYLTVRFWNKWLWVWVQLQSL